MRLLLFASSAFASCSTAQAFRFSSSSQASLRGKATPKILQIGDDRYISQYEPWALTVKQYAEDHGVHHAVVSSDAHPLVDVQSPCSLGHCYVSRKPEYIMREMDESGGDTSWLIFLDLDVAIADPEAFARAKFGKRKMPMQSKITTSAMTLLDYLESLGGSCEFVVQGSHHTVNSGFLAFKGPFDATSESLSRDLVRLWKNETDRIQPYGSWVGDQGPLQSALLTLALQEFNAFSDSKCDLRVQDAHSRNLCWDQMMARLSLPSNNRSFGKYCIFGSEHRWNMHDSGDFYRYGDVLYHGKDRRVVESIQHQREQRVGQRRHGHPSNPHRRDHSPPGEGQKAAKDGARLTAQG